jgi:hypothetical protein
MVSNVRDRNIDSSRREDSRKGQVDRCEVINVRPHVAPYPEDKDFNTVDVQLIDRPRINGKPLHIKYVKLNSLQREHGRFQGNPWNARIGDMIYVYWLAEREALVLGTCTSVEQEPVCRSQADAHHQEYVFKLSPWEEPKQNDDHNYVEFPNPKHPECYKWWPKTRDSLWIFDCLEGHNTPSCCAQACNSLDDHQSSTCFKNFSDISPTTIDLPRRFKFLHHCGSFWYYDDDGTIEIASKLNAALKCHQTFYPSGRILLQNDVTGNFVDIKAADEVEIDAATIRLDGDVVITGSCTHGSCSCGSTFVSLDGKAGGQTLCGGTEEDEELTLCGTSDVSKGCVTVDADLECTGLLGDNLKTLIEACCTEQTGWLSAGENWTFASADSPTFTFTISGDKSAKYSPGMRIRIDQSGIKYFIITSVSYSSPDTTITVYGGTDYTMTSATIESPCYSMLKAPVGFPLSPAKWSVSLVDSVDRYQNNPVKDTVYNLGSLSVTLPIGVWNVFFQVVSVCAAASGAYTDIYSGLSTSLSSFNNQSLRGRTYLGTNSGGAGISIGNITRSTILTLTSKTTYYVLCMTDLENQSIIGFNGAADASTEVLAICAYL